MKKKSILRIILFVVLIAALQISVSAGAKTKINKSSVTLGIGKTYDLKITGTKKKVSWSVSRKAVSVKKLTKTGTSQGKSSIKQEGRLLLEKLV